jgi:hypothetical protein
MVSCSPSQVRTGHPPAAVSRSDLQLEKKGHQMSVHTVQAKIERESVTEANVQPLTVIGSYRLF